jgi:hypothetical protein
VPHTALGSNHNNLSAQTTITLTTTATVPAGDTIIVGTGAFNTPNRTMAVTGGRAGADDGSPHPFLLSEVQHGLVRGGRSRGGRRISDAPGRVALLGCGRQPARPGDRRHEHDLHGGRGRAVPHVDDGHEGLGADAAGHGRHDRRGSVTAANTHTVAPTLVDMGFRTTLGAAVGSAFVWTFGGDVGLNCAVGTGNGIGIYIPTGTGQVLDFYFVWAE